MTSSIDMDALTSQSQPLLAVFAAPEAPPPPPEPDPWDVLQEGFDALRESLSKDPMVGLSYKRDPMDDSEVLSLWIKATAFEPSGYPGSPGVHLTARRFKRRRTELLGCFDLQQSLYRKGKEAYFRLRRDGGAVETFEGSLSTDFRAVFGPESRLLFAMATSDRMLLEVSTPRAGPFIGTFDPGLHREALDVFCRVVLGKDHARLLQSPAPVVERLLLWGPTYTRLYKEGLRQLGFYKGAINSERELALFEAVTAYAHSRRASEIYGPTENGTKLNSPWSLTLYDELSADLRARIGPLTIND